MEIYKPEYHEITQDHVHVFASPLEFPEKIKEERMTCDYLKVNF